MEPAFRRWFTAIPHTYNGDSAIWNRLEGDLCLTFRKLGLDSRLVMFGDPCQYAELPLITCTPAQMQESAWWKQWELDGVMLISWGTPRYEPIARAIKESGCKLVIRLDTDGMKSPRIHFGRFLKGSYYHSRQERKSFHLLYALVKTLAFRFVPAAFDRRTCAHLEHADIVLVESSLGKHWLRRYFSKLDRPDLAAKLRVLPHQAKAEIVYDPAIPKLPQVMGVARWDAFQKDGAKFMKVLGAVLPHFPDYSAILAGTGNERMEKLRSTLSAPLRSRIIIAGLLDHAALHRRYQEAQVLLFTSRYEGFPVAASEALCCGCTVVGAASLSSMNYISSLGGGTAAISRSSQDYADALASELHAWQAGERDPERISQDWQKRVSSTAVASAILQSVSSLKTSAKPPG
jgi:hypothetical protein